MSNELTTQIKSALETKEALNKMLSFFGDDKEKVTRFKSALVTISQNKILAKCSLQSILTSAFNLAEVGLEISPILSQCYIAKYKNEAEPVISYKGWKTLIERTGKSIKAYSVFKCDNFTMDLSGYDEEITFIPNFNDRKESDDAWFKSNLLGVLIKIKDENGVKNHFVSVSKIEKIKSKSPSANSEDSPYNLWAEETYQAKAIKYVLSREALNFKEENIGKAIILDNALDMKYQKEERSKTDNNAKLESIINNNEPVSDEIELISVDESESGF